MIRVALLATTIDFGGIEKVLLTLLKHLGNDVEFVPVLFTRTDVRDRSFFDRLNAMGIRYRTIFVNRSRPRYLNPIRNIGESIAALRSERIDAIHSHGYRADLIALFAAWYLGVPVVSTCHGFIRTDANLTLYARLDLFLLRYFRRVIAVSGQMRDDLLARGLKAERVVAVQNAVELPRESTVHSVRRDARARLSIGDDEFVWGYVGRLSQEKGVRHLLDAVQLQTPAAGPWRLLIVGDGPQRAELEVSVRSAGLAERISFTGFQADTSSWYAAMDGFVLPSLTEGTPMALLEAMAHRLPVVASEVGGVPAVVSNRVNGLLVPSADPAALSAALREISENTVLRRALAQAAFQTVRDGFDVRTWAERVRGVYEQALLEPSPA